MQPISVVIADAQYLIRLGLKHLLNEVPHIYIVAEAANHRQLEKAVTKHEPDVVILDYNKPLSFSIDNVAAIKELSAATNVLVISADDTKDHIFKALKLGVNSFLTKECDKKEIIDAIHATAKGEKFFCHKILEIIIEKHLSPPSTQNCAPSKLTTREIEILQLIAEGVTTKEIAYQLNLSTHTIYTHRKNIMKKLGLNSSSEMILYAVKSGMVTAN